MIFKPPGWLPACTLASHPSWFWSRPALSECHSPIAATSARSHGGAVMGPRMAYPEGFLWHLVHHTELASVETLAEHSWGHPWNDLSNLHLTTPSSKTQSVLRICCVHAICGWNRAKHLNTSITQYRHPAGSGGEAAAPLWGAAEGRPYIWLIEVFRCLRVLRELADPALCQHIFWTSLCCNMSSQI